MVSPQTSLRLQAPACAWACACACLWYLRRPRYGCRHLHVHGHVHVAGGMHAAPREPAATQCIATVHRALHSATHSALHHCACPRTPGQAPRTFARGDAYSNTPSIHAKALPPTCHDWNYSGARRRRVGVPRVRQRQCHAPRRLHAGFLTPARHPPPPLGRHPRPRPNPWPRFS